MKLRLVLFSLLIFCTFVYKVDAMPTLKKKKFENPALQFEGTWRVDSYDFREFDETPENLDEQLKDEASAFPIGQRIKFVWTGSEVMPGTIDPVTMKSNGPIGETLKMTILQPFEKKLCFNYWKFLCDGKEEDYVDGLMINMKRWDDRLKNKRKLWLEMNPIDYSFGHLGKSYGFNVWTAKNNDIVFSIVVDGQKKGGGDAARMGIRLKRIDD